MTDPELIPTRLAGLRLLRPAWSGDERGFFAEIYRRDVYERLGVRADFVQANHSRSARGVLRGLHYQIAPGQAKLVRATRGRIFDVAVDLRRASPTFGQWEAFELDDLNHAQLYIPVGFAHGFCVLSDEADVVYQVGSYYEPQAERGVMWNDPEVAVEWPIASPLVSARDSANPRFDQIKDELPF